MDDWKELDLKIFKISIPIEWNYQKIQGEDSFVGKITSSKSFLSFDYSINGFAEDIAPYDDADDISEIKKVYHLKIKKTEKYIIKTIWPKVTGTGMTAIYFKSRSSALNFNIIGDSLSRNDQELALRAFKTIVLKNR